MLTENKTKKRKGKKGEKIYKTKMSYLCELSMDDQESVCQAIQQQQQEIQASIQPPVKGKKVVMGRS